MVICRLGGFKMSRTVLKDHIISAIIYDLNLMMNRKLTAFEVSKYLKKKATELEGDNVRDNSNVIYISNVSNVIERTSNVIEEK